VKSQNVILDRSETTVYTQLSKINSKRRGTMRKEMSTQASQQSIQSQDRVNKEEKEGE
jgi:hypothetical protein